MLKKIILSPFYLFKYIFLFYFYVCKYTFIFFKKLCYYFFILPINILRNIKHSYTNVEQFDGMDGHEFEYVCADILRKNGFHSVEVTKGSGDFGVDIIAKKGNLNYAIQCKCYNHKLNNAPIQEVVAGMSAYNCNAAAVMTNQYFTEPAKELARINNVELWDADVLSQMMSKNYLSTKIHKKPNNANNIETQPVAEMKTQGLDETKENCFNKLETSKNKTQLFKDLYDAITKDKIIKDAVQVIVNEKTASTSFLQRKLSLGYAKAARMMDELEQIGIIGEFNGLKPRTINITVLDWDEYLKQYPDHKIIQLKDNKTKSTHKILSNEQIQIMISLDDFKENNELYKQHLKQASEYIINFYAINTINIKIENIDINYETCEEIYEIKLLDNKTRTSQIKKSTRELALHLGVDYVEYVFPTSTKGTVGLRMPLPAFMSDDIKLLNKFMKNNQM